MNILCDLTIHASCCRARNTPLREFVVERQIHVCCLLKCNFIKLGVVARWLAWSHIFISTHPLLSLYFLTTYSYKCMHLIISSLQYTIYYTQNHPVANQPIAEQYFSI